MTNKPVRILIVDDSLTYRTIIRQALDSIPNVEVVGSAGSGARALELLAAGEVDLVTLDVVMPGMDGLETLKKIKQAKPDTNVVMVSGVEEEAARITMEALEAGALDFIPKPAAKSREEASGGLSQELVSKIDTCRYRRASSATVTSPDSSPAAVVERPKPKKDKDRRSTPILTQVDLVAIGVSTGGPTCLAQIIPKLPADLPVPVLVVQHMPALFTKSMADHLARKSAIAVNEAVADQVIMPGEVLIAPGGKHMEVRPVDGELKVKITEDPPVNSCRPAVDVLFRSLARYCQDLRILVVILTGMGADGAQGTKLISSTCKKSRVLIQDEASAVVWGMPGAVAQTGLVDEILDQEEIGPRITTYATGRYF